MGKDKISFGIALCRIKNNQPQILLCRRRVTYEYIEFVFGKYHPNDRGKILSLLNGMTASEKIEILTLDFSRIWWRMSLSSSDTFSRICKRKFENNFLRDGGRNIKNLIANSLDGELLWEIPKGRANENELPLDAAIRETNEEVGVTPHEYTILHGITPISCVVHAYSVQYNMRFFIAKYNAVAVDMSFQKRHILEVDAVSWWTLSELQNATARENKFLHSIAIECCKKYANYMKR